MIHQSAEPCGSPKNGTLPTRIPTASELACARGKTNAAPTAATAASQGMP